MLLEDRYSLKYFQRQTSMKKEYISIWILLFLLFGFVHNAGYVTDYIGWQERVIEGGFWGALHTYDYPAQLQGYALMMWLTEHMRSISPWLVHASSISLYAGGTLLLKNLVQSVLFDHGSKNHLWAGWLAAGLFALSPSNTEIVIWRVCPHYLISIIVWISSLLLLRTYLNSGKNSSLYWALGVQVIGLFSLELAYALPIAVLGWTTYYVFFLKTGTWRRAFIATLGAISLVALHLLLTKIVQGTWIGHYGADVATSQPLSEIIAAPWRWIMRSGFHYRFWSRAWKKGLTSYLGNPAVSLALYLIVALALSLAVKSWSRLRKTNQLPSTWTALLLWVFLAGAGTAAISQLYFYDHFPIENDRLGTLSIVFVAALIATLAASMPKKLGKPLGIIVIAISCIIQFRAINSWAESQHIITSLASSYTDRINEAIKLNKKPEQVYLIGYARSFKGVQMLADYRPGFSALAGYLSSSVSFPNTGMQQGVELVDVSQFHQLALTDKYKARWEDGKMYVALNAPGSWMMQKDLGVKNRFVEKYGYDLKVEEYRIVLSWETPPKKNTIFLYQEFDHFVRLPYKGPYQ